ncbi:MAG: helix-turn-helix transcriptional regulator [Actinomycetales bacterium]|nr:helix-turn-helix transcriptional regulator [Actinomycetales bacterium]
MQEEPGLRAARLKQTWLDIHYAAAEDCLKSGPENVNTAKIAESVGVSSRTFFNYFATKEDAILGIGRPELRPKHLEAFLKATRQPPLLRVCLLTVSVVATALGKSSDQRYRLDLVKKYPELNTRMTDTVLKARDLVLDELVLDAEELWLGAQGMPTDRDEAQVLVMVAFSVLAFSWRRDPQLLAENPEKALKDSIQIVVSTVDKSL